MAAEAPTPTRAYWDDIACQASGPSDWLWRVHVDAMHAALCRRWLPASGIARLLKTDLFDEAHGAGLWSALRGLAGRVDAVDISPAMAAAARARHPALPAGTADVRRLPFADATFDAIVSNSTLDHFERLDDLRQSLRELHRVLVPGGRLLLTLDNPSHPIVGLRNALPFRWVARTGLVPYFVGATLGPTALSRALQETGFDVRDLTAILHCPRVLMIPLAVRLGRSPRSPATRARFLARLMAFEHAEGWPTRFRTGHFVAALGVRR